MHNGPGKFTVTAGMSGSMHNNHTAQVLLLNPVELELPESLAEWITGTAIQVILNESFELEWSYWRLAHNSSFTCFHFSISHQVPVAIYGFDPDTKERVRSGAMCIFFFGGGGGQGSFFVYSRYISTAAAGALH